VPTSVSVVVPVYNAGAYVEPCVESLLGQTMPADDLELIFVNDGSTDGSLERLQNHASQHPQLRVITIPNSGWPGKPRNVGTDAAEGEYVMFVDQDDTLEPETLERMYRLGSANGADVVLGKVISDFRGVHHNLYRRNRARCDVFSADLMNSLTPHKMLRTTFLREQQIRYPEGPRRLEDQLFMTKAYFAAGSATIVADYVCYRYLRRPDGKNAGSKRIEPAEYYANLAEVLDVVDAHTEPGEQRNGFYRRFLRTEMLGRLAMPNLLSAPEPYVSSLLTEVRGLMQRRFPVSVDDGLGAALRARAALTRTGPIEEIAAQADRIRSLRCVAHVTACELTRRAIVVELESRLFYGADPLWLEGDSATGYRLPSAVLGRTATAEDCCIEPPDQMQGDVVIRHRDTSDEWFVPAPLQARVEQGVGGHEVVWRGSVSLTPDDLAGGQPLRAGLHDLYVRIEAFGLTRTGRLGAGDVVADGPILVTSCTHINRLYGTELNNLSLNVNARRHWLERALAAARVRVAGDQVRVRLGVTWSGGRPPLLLKIATSPQEPPVTCLLSPRRSRAQEWKGHLGNDHVRLAPGGHAARLRVRAGRGVGAVSVRLARSVQIPRPPAPSSTSRTAESRLRRLYLGTRRLAQRRRSP